MLCITLFTKKKKSYVERYSKPEVHISIMSSVVVD